MVKGLGKAAAERLLDARSERCFKDIQDLCDRAQLNRRELNALAEAAALRGVAGHRHRARWETAAVTRQPDDLLYGVREGREAESPGARKPRRRQVVIRPPGAWDELEADYHSTGLTLGRHPLSFVRGRLRARRIKQAAQVIGLPHGTRTRACGLVTMRQRPMTANGTLFLTLEDETGTVNVVIWPRLWERQRAVALGAGLIAVDGVLESDGSVHHLIAERLHDYDELLGEFRARSRDFR
jgi:error-prone DNA polymerase